MNDATALDLLAFDFFREFARCEYCLKAVGLRGTNRRNPTADWVAFAAEVQNVFLTPPSQEVAIAINYFLQYPPKKQVLHDGHLDWSETPPAHKNQAELVLLLVCRVRNNLFHGGKFNGHWFAPQRSKELLDYGLRILQAVIAAHPMVREAYANKTV